MSHTLTSRVAVLGCGALIMLGACSNQSHSITGPMNPMICFQDSGAPPGANAASPLPCRD